MTENRMHRLLARIALASTLLLGPMTSSASAQEMEIGLREFMQRCATCHGPRGAGDGPMAAILKVAPRDLRTLTHENGGTFPFVETYKAIDGRREIKAHGSSTMPLWGDYFHAEALARDMPAGIDAEQVVMGRILSIVYYLQAIQMR